MAHFLDKDGLQRFFNGLKNVFAAKNHTHSTQDLRRPAGLRGLNDNTLQTLVSTARANRLAFLPGSQVIIEKTVDGGATWTDAGYSDDVKNALFSEQRVTVALPTINGKNSTLCGIRITFTAMRYNVPAGTAETAKYNYWNSNYVQSQERYTQLKELYFWLNTGANSMSVKAERANPSTSTTWSTIFNDTSFYMTGWSGCDYISFGQNTFGGSTSQVSQPWNYRLTFFTRGPNNSDTVHATTTSVQAIYEIRGYGDSVWGISNRYMAEDKLYSFDRLQNVTFPAQITATSFSGSGASLTSLNGSNISSGTVAAARIASLDASKIGSGTLDAARIPSLAASKITSGTFDAARIPSLNASKIGSGTLAAARLPAMTGATASAAGTQGAVPAPAAGDQEMFLRGDGQWAAPSAGGGIFVVNEVISGDTNRLDKTAAEVWAAAQSSMVIMRSNGGGMTFIALMTTASQEIDGSNHYYSFRFADKDFYTDSDSGYPSYESETPV